MKKKALIWIIVLWSTLMLLNYYYVPYFILAFEWLGLCLTLLIVCIVQFIMLINEGRNITRGRVQKVIVFTVLFVASFLRLSDRIIERLDWAVFLNRRAHIVEQVRKGQLNPNVSWNDFVCVLPYQFPIVSNGGNDICIYRSPGKETTTVSFWIFRNFFEAPSTQFVYTDDSDEILHIEEKIKQHPSDNWKIKDHWYRTRGD